MDESSRVHTLLHVVQELTKIDHTALSEDGPTDLGPVLRRTVDLACEVTGAKYGALGVLTDDGSNPEGAGTLSHFVSSGISAAEQAAIGRPPQATGVLGKVVHEVKAVRVAELSAEPDFRGFPAGHPIMHSFLGMPLRAGKRVFGNLYLADKLDGEPFGEEDEGLLEALASVAGVVIDLTRQRQEADLRRATGESVRAINGQLLKGNDPATALSMVTASAVRVSGADQALIVALDALPPHQEGEPRPRDGEFQPALEVLAFTQESYDDDDHSPGEATRATKVLDRLRETVDRVATLGVGEHVPGPTSTTAPLLESQTGPPHTSVVPVPLNDDRQVVFIVAGWHCAPATGPTMTQDFVTLLAEQAGLVLDRIRSAENHDAMTKVGDRERIAHDLHDLVIQRIFAAGLTLQGAARLNTSPDVGERVERTISELDATIRDIRATIFALSPVSRGVSIEAQVSDLVRGYASILGFVPTVRFAATSARGTAETAHGALESVLDEDGRVALLMVLREALSNVARHALAGSVHVEVTADDQNITLVVTDDGVGVSGQAVQSGLRNVRLRAQQRGGSMDLTGHAPRGTVLRWQVPIRP